MKDTQDRSDDNEVWYAVADPLTDSENIADPDADCWTVSTDPNEPGWNTDCGHQGYGLRRADAEFLAAAANEKIAKEKQKMNTEKVNGAAPPEPSYVNQDLVNALTRLLEEAKAGRVVNAAIAMTAGPGNSGFIVPNGPGIADVYLALGAIRLLIEQGSFPFVVDKTMAEYQQRMMRAAATSPKLILPNGPVNFRGGH